MYIAELVRWAVVAAIATAMLRFPRPTGFWSLGPRQALVLARSGSAPGRFRDAARV